MCWSFFISFHVERFTNFNPLLLTNNIEYNTKNIEHENWDNIALKLSTFNILISKIKIFIL